MISAVQKSFLVLACLLISVASHAQPNQSEPTKKAIYIILDGISAEVIETQPTPNIDEITSMGGYQRATTGGLAGGYSESPTASAIGYNHLLTGTWSNKHNVYTNSIRIPNYRYWSLYRLVETVKPELKTAIYSSWTDNRTKLVGEGLEASGAFNIDVVKDGYDLDEETFPHDSAYVRGIDDKVTKEAAASIRLDAPDFSWVYLWYPDDTGHQYGEVEEHLESVRHADSQVGKIWDSIKYREENFDEEWLVIVTTDHGRALPEGRHHGWQSERERTVWFSVKSNDLNGYFEEGDLQHVDLYPSVARFLGIDIPKHLEMELDGAPFIGDVSLSGVSASLQKDNGLLQVEWKSWHSSGKVTIKVAVTNQYKMGGEDEYYEVGSTALSKEIFEVDLHSVLSADTMWKEAETIKVLVEGKYNSGNFWIVEN